MSRPALTSRGLGTWRGLYRRGAAWRTSPRYTNPRKAPELNRSNDACWKPCEASVAHGKAYVTGGVGQSPSFWTLPDPEFLEQPFARLASEYASRDRGVRVRVSLFYFDTRQTADQVPSRGVWHTERQKHSTACARSRVYCWSRRVEEAPLVTTVSNDSFVQPGSKLYSFPQFAPAVVSTLLRPLHGRLGRLWETKPTQ